MSARRTDGSATQGHTLGLWQRPISIGAGLALLLIAVMMLRPLSAAQPQDSCAALAQFEGELAPLLADRAEMLAILDRLDQHLMNFPDTDPDVAVAATHHLWQRACTHGEKVRALTVPATCSLAVTIYRRWLDNFNVSIECRYNYYEYLVWHEMAPVYPSEYGETQASYDALADMYLAQAEREYEEFEAEMAAAAKACP